MKSFSFIAAGGLFLSLFISAVIDPFPQIYADAENEKAPAAAEVPVGPVTKNRPQDPSGTKVMNTYPEGFLTLSEPSIISEPEEKPAPIPQIDSINTRPANWAFLIGAITSVALFLVVAWTDHTYRVRLQSIVAQNNRLLNGEDIDLISDAPAVGLPLFFGSSETAGSDFNSALNEFLSESSDSAPPTETTV